MHCIYEGGEEMKKVLRIVLMILTVLAAAGITLTYKSYDDSDLLKVTLLKVGKADAIVLENQGRVMVIDTGEEDDGLKIAEFIRNEGFYSIDLLLITHYDKDHVGGGDVLLQNIPADLIYLPDYESDSLEYSDFVKTAKERNCPMIRVNKEISLKFGSCDVLIEGPDSYQTDAKADYDNNLSLIVSVTHQQMRLLFTADIEKQRIHEWLLKDRGTYDFMKIPHHGIYESALEDLIAAVKPKYAAICDSDKNPAETKTLELIKIYGISVLETRNGRITVISDGKKMTMRQK